MVFLPIAYNVANSPLINLSSGTQFVSVLCFLLGLDCALGLEEHCCGLDEGC